MEITKSQMKAESFLAILLKELSNVVIEKALREFRQGLLRAWCE